MVTTGEDNPSRVVAEWERVIEGAPLEAVALAAGDRMIGNGSTGGQFLYIAITARRMHGYRSGHHISTIFECSVPLAWLSATSVSVWRAPWWEFRSHNSQPTRHSRVSGAVVMYHTSTGMDKSDILPRH